MRKIALTLTAASMIFSGLAGCGDVNDTGMNNTNQGQQIGQQTGFGVNDNRTNPTGLGTNDGTTGNRIGFGYNDNNGYGTRGAGTGNYRFGTQPGGTNDENITRRNGTGLQYERNFGNAENYVAQNRNVTRDGQNFGGLNRNGARNGQNFGAQNNNTNSAYEARINNRRDGATGFGRGITGNDRPGMVDENGVVNDRTREQRGTTGLNRGTNGTRGFNRGTNDGTLNHGKRNGTTTGQQTRTSDYFNGEDGRLATNMTDRLSGANGVNDAHVIVHGNDVLVGVDSDNDFNDNTVRDRIGNLSGDRNVHVVTDRERVNDIRGLNDRLRAGEAFEEVGATFNEMLGDLGDAVQRPFERSR
ncbi:YhcN/YlaJ family sporulation lipoprotein [Evansella cellulosilytica]|uniref:Sporulation lipoprotein YhcN/YlaJ-like protein n=1 Tax=Evansella cellulosilytica (strain ATCC 21833 / DSM 2522 / FERM P-1141 / JCM 9156 / N-4) TaxID=649639 RepID=E6TV67_EVAC2|nr:YhcN/YlaJ family sporulation lipoprotein [Evansella cellulosilytica]ADU29751.1 Sporulation lipoprotein YhcN/YlaJ-like protein [Evansella cellulosilytica DSM 2522]